MTLPKLYSISSKGVPLEWQIFVESDYFYTVAGQIDGQKVTSAPNKCTGKNLGKKNETSPHEQACAEAKAKWDKKLKTDYHLKLEDINKPKYIEPMLAKNFKDRLGKVVYPVLVQRKLNGGRIIATKNGLFTRKGERYISIPHIEEALKPFFEKWPDAVLDGEGYNHDYRFKLNEIMEFLRKTKNITPEDLESSKAIEYHVYDGYNCFGSTEESSQANRGWCLLGLKEDKYIKRVDGYRAENESEVWHYYESFVKDGYEGAMVRLWNAPYKHGRSSDLLKVKPEDDSEGEILQVIEGSGNWGGVAKTFKIRWQGQEFDATVKGSFEQAGEILKNPNQWIGKTVTFLYNGLTGLGTPNFARVDVNNCLKH